MSIDTDTMKNYLATAYGELATHAALYSTVPAGSSPGTELAGGSPPYARKPITWSAPNTDGPAGDVLQPATPGIIYGQVVFDVEGGDTVRGAGVHSASTSGYLDGAAVTEQGFATQGTYTLRLSSTVS